MLIKTTQKNITVNYNEPRFPIGTRFIPVNGDAVYEVVDVLLSVSTGTGEVSYMVTYVTHHEFMGQIIKWECPEATIARSEIVN